MAEELISKTFTITKELTVILEKWAEEQDRSISAVLRQILKKEVERQKQAQKGEKNDN